MASITRLGWFWIAPVFLTLTACARHPAPGETQATSNSTVAATSNGEPAPFDTPNCSDASNSDSTDSNADVRGVRAGMPLDAAILHLECLDPSKSAARETLTNTIGVNYYGHQIRTHVHVATGTPRSSDELARTSAYYGGGPGTPATFNYHWGLKQIDTSYDIVAFGEAGSERVYGIEQSQEFTAGNQPTVANLESSLITKYGTPSKQAPGNNFGHILVWIHDPSGALVSPGSPLVNNCVLESSAVEGDWRSNCALTVVANVSWDGANPLLVTKLKVGLVDQGALVNEAAQASAAWQAQSKAAQEGAAAKAAKVKTKL